MIKYYTQIIHSTLALMRDSKLITQQAYKEIIDVLTVHINSRSDAIKNTRPLTNFMPTSVKKKYLGIND